MIVQFLLFVIAVLLVSIFWELTKINNRLKALLPPQKIMTGQSETPHDIRKQPNPRTVDHPIRLLSRASKTYQDAVA